MGINGAVKFVGYYDAFGIDQNDEDIYYMTAENTLKHTGVARTLHACRAYFQFDETDPNVGQSRQFILNFGDDDATTGIVSMDDGKLIMDNEAGAVYDLQGRKIDNRKSVNRKLPKGLYIYKGKKTVVK